MLEEMQEWFGETLLKKEYEQDASRYVTAGPALSADEKLALYHRGFWLKHLNFLKKFYPTLVRELKDRFDDEIGIPFLLKNRPDHWSLHTLGKRVPDWLEGHLATIAKVDWAAEVAFWEKAHDLIDFSTWSEKELYSKKLYLQPYITLFALDADYLTYRETNELFERECYFVVYRSPEGLAAWKEIDDRQYKLLSLFENGCSIEEACAQIEGGNEIAFWFKEWTSWHFFSQSSLASLSSSSPKQKDGDALSAKATKSASKS